jgi:DNA-binding NarL/FixJ family response regulator
MSDTATFPEALARVQDLETELQQRDETIVRLRADLLEAHELVDRMRQRTEDANAAIDNWVMVFEMSQDEAGVYRFDRSQSGIWDAYSELLDNHRKLIAKWNKYVGRFNARVAPQDIGRPLAASDAQKADVMKRRKAGESMRAIAKAMSLSLRTVRTIVEKANGADRTAKASRELRRMEFNRQRAAAFRVRKAGRDAMPKQVTQLVTDGAALVKAAKGLGRD